MIHTTQEYQIGDNVELMRKMPAESIDTIITSPPYWGLRDYGVDGQIGLEPTLEEYHARMLEVTAECMRVLKPTGVMFWNHGDSYGDNKSLDMQNERLIIRMIDDQGWILRNRIIWNKPNGMPSSVTDRFSNKYEPVYMLAKSKKYWFDLDAVRDPYTKPMNRWGGQKLKADGDSKYTNGNVQGGYRERDMRPNPLGKNPGDVWKLESPEDDWKFFIEIMAERIGSPQLAISIFESYLQARDAPYNVWTIPTQPYPESHFATFPTALIEPMIKAACPAEICPVCGLARERIVELGSVVAIGGSDNGKMADNVDAYIDSATKCKQTITREHHTIGWTSCSCGAGWIAGTVLDPSCGSGTVLEVCRLLNRNARGLELNPDYEPLIKERSMAHTPVLQSYF